MPGKKIRNLALVFGLATVFALADKAYSSFFNLGFTPAADQESVYFTGRLAFDNLGYPRTAEIGDEVGFFRDNVCIGLSSSIDPIQSHYLGLRVYIDDLRTPMVDGLRPALNLEQGTDYVIRAYNSQTKSVWDVEVMGGKVAIGGVGVQQLNLKANQIPEPETMTLFGLAALLAGRPIKQGMKSRRGL